MIRNTNFSQSTLIRDKLQIMNSRFNISMRVNFPMPECIRVSKDNFYIFSAHQDGSIRIWDLITPFKSHIYYSHMSPITALAVSSKWVISSSRDKITKIWDYENNSESGNITTDTVCSLIIFPNNEVFALGTIDGTILLWNFTRMQLITPLNGHKGSVTGLGITKNEKFLISGSEDNSIIIWDLQKQTQISNFLAHDERISAIWVKKDIFLTGSWDMSIKIWNLKTQNLITCIKGHTGDILSILTKKANIISGSSDNTIKVWSKKSFELLFSFNLEHRIKNIVLIGDFVASTSVDKNIKIWNLEKKRLESIVTGHFFDVLSISISYNKKYAVSGSKDKTIRIWDLLSQRQIGILCGHSNIVKSVKFSWNDEFVISYADDKKIMIWDLNIMAAVMKIDYENKESSIENCWLSDKFAVFVLGSFDFQIWDRETQQKFRSFNRKYRLLLNFKAKVRIK